MNVDINSRIKSFGTYSQECDIRLNLQILYIAVTYKEQIHVVCQTMNASIDKARNWGWISHVHYEGSYHHGLMADVSPQPDPPQPVLHLLREHLCWLCLCNVFVKLIMCYQGPFFLHPVWTLPPGPSTLFKLL